MQDLALYSYLPAHRSVVTYLTSSVVLSHAFLFAGVPCVPSVALGSEAYPTPHTLLYRLTDIEQRFVNGFAFRYNLHMVSPRN